MEEEYKKLNLDDYMTVIVISHDHNGYIYIQNGYGEPLTPKELIKELKRIDKVYNEQILEALGGKNGLDR